MGGSGSGRFGQRGGRKKPVEDCRSLEIGRWVREGGIAPGVVSSGAWKWSRHGETLASIGYETRCDVQPAYVRLHYTWNDSVQLDYRVELDRTRLTFGLRWWFCCPCCGRRAAKLYLVGKLFICRKCGGLTYESRQENRRQTNLFCALIGAELGMTAREMRQTLRKERFL